MLKRMRASDARSEQRQRKALLLVMLMVMMVMMVMLVMPQRCLDGDLNATSVVDGALRIGESDSALMLKSDERFVGAHRLVDLVEVSGSSGCSVHGETDAASELITVGGSSKQSVVSISPPLFLIVPAAEDEFLPQMMLLRGELSDVGVR